MDRGFEKLERLLQGYEERIRAVETQEAACQPIVNSRLTAVETRLSEHDQAIRMLNKLVDELSQTNKILKWVLGVLTAVLIAIIVGLVTGQLQVSVP